MISLVQASTATPEHKFSTTELVASMMHKFSPELINSICSLGVENRYSTMDNYADFLDGCADEPDKFDDGTRRERDAQLHRGMGRRSFTDRFADCRDQYA